MSQLPLFDEPPRDAPIGTVDRWVRSGIDGHIMGVDEAGRGPLAGPVVAAAVVLPEGPLPASLDVLNDSKLLNEATRERLAPLIQTHALAVGLGLGSVEEIDAINILESTRKAMHRAIAQASERLDSPVGALLVDGHLPLPEYTGQQWALVKGDSRSWAIAAASVLAKVERDRLMMAYDQEHPGYGFGQHKGYGTVAHRRAMHSLGLSIIHRRSFSWKVPNDQ